jgi:hypothetical protein
LPSLVARIGARTAVGASRRVGSGHRTAIAGSHHTVGELGVVDDAEDLSASNEHGRTRQRDEGEA